MTVFDDQNAKAIRDIMDVVIEVKATINGTEQTFTYTNDDLISVELNLRSDLSPIDPSLPESEIVVRVYEPEDISDIVKLIADDQPLTYKAGYNGTYCPERKFYISEQVTWADKVLTFKAVDAVHFLEKKAVACITGNPTMSYSGSAILTKFFFGVNTVNVSKTDKWGCFTDIFRYISAMLEGMGISFTSEAVSTISNSTELPIINSISLLGGDTIKDFIANVNNLVHIDFPSVFDKSAYWITYIDAGIPTLKWNKPTSIWNISESDCGDIVEKVDRDIISITGETSSLQPIDYKRDNYIKNTKVGSIQITKNVGGSLSLDIPSLNATAIFKENTSYALPLNPIGEMEALPTKVEYDYSSAGYKVFEDNGFVEWDSNMSTFWSNAVSRGVADDAVGEATFDIYAPCVMINANKSTYTKSGSGVAKTAQKTKWLGRSYLKSSGGTTYKVLPDMGFKQLLNRSTKTGSFIWKGDPRMQPRDVFTFTKLDGTTELRTIESINLKHEGGGLVAKITYRKGIV